MALEALCEGVWVAAVPHTMMGLHLGTRMTVVKLPGGGLWVHSPVPLEPHRAAVEALGPVEHVVCPNVYHHSYAGEWTAAFPQARLWGPKRLAKKRRDLAFTGELSAAAPVEWGGAFTPVPIDGCTLHETVFVHAPSATAICSDLLENFDTSPHGPTRLYLKMAGIHGKPGWSRLLRFVYRDRAAAWKSVEALCEHPFERLVLAHGHLLPQDPKPVLREGLAFLRG